VHHAVAAPVNAGFSNLQSLIAAPGSTHSYHTCIYLLLLLSQPYHNPNAYLSNLECLSDFEVTCNR
jgi:hypothetical protein